MFRRPKNDPCACEAAKACAACEAKDKTILVMADEIDWLRGQVGASMQSATQAVAPERFRPASGNPDEKLWFNEDEEEIVAQIEAGVLGEREAEAALARVQAFNTTVTRAS